MIANFDQARVELDRALFLRLVDAGGTHIVCLEGSLWITRDGCPKDVVLAGGETYRVEDAGRVIVTAFCPSLAQLFQPAPPRRSVARRRLLWALPAWGRHLAAG